MKDTIERLRKINDMLLSTGQDFSDVLLDAANEIERLRAELAALVNLRAEADSAWDSATYNAERARKAEAELAACREDAERYRHVRANPAMLLHLSNKAFDDAIDAARKGEGE